MTTQVVPAAASGHVTGGNDRLAGLDVIRVLALVLVLYTQLASWFRTDGEPLGASSLVDDFLVTPLRLDADLRFFGAALIFLVTGFLVARSAARQGPGEFAARRLLRVFPPLWFAALLAWTLVALGQPAVPGVGDADVDDLVSGLLLANFFQAPGAALVGAAWALLPILAVYAMVGLLLPVFRRSPWLAIAIQVTVCSVLLSIMPNFDTVAAAAGGTIGAFGTAVVLGEVIWLVWAGHSPLWVGACLGLACWVVFAWADRLGYHAGEAYPLALAYVFLLVVAAVLLGGSVRRLPPVDHLASRSFGILLTHQAVTAAVLAPIAGHTWSALAVAAAVLATLVAAELLHQATERPAALLARRLREGAS
ncbi:MAG: acyltransferase family protein [Actinophytocola sp.]|uniref:acyltransferase family protein n=1 Tax=Actinophytocola sp. TaxID=1872138 RepID=UPI0013249150|nr:acyltransferase [Actinophytocola sp.]MPZ81363.1 acyltransferase family protein [Actinophytocola sp.]